MEVALMIMMVNLKHDGNIGKPLRPKSAIFSNIVQTDVDPPLDRVPAWLWEVRRVNKPPKKWYFNFQGQFLNQKKFYI